MRPDNTLSARPSGACAHIAIPSARPANLPARHAQACARRGQTVAVRRDAADIAPVRAMSMQKPQSSVLLRTKIARFHFCATVDRSTGFARLVR